MLETFRKLFDLLPSTDRLKFAGLFVLMMIGTVLELIGIGMIPVFISAVADADMVLQNEWAQPLLAALGIETARDLLIAGGIALIAIFFVKGVYLVWLHYVKARFIQGRFAFIAGMLFRTYMHAPYTFHLSRNTAELIRNVTNETSFIANQVLVPFFHILMQSLTILGIFLLLLYFEPVITLVAFLVIGGGGGLVLKLLKSRIRYYGKMAARERGRMIQGVNEGLGGFKDVTVMNRQNWFISRFRHFVNNLKKAQIFQVIANQSIRPVLDFIAVAGMMLIAMLMVSQGRPVAAIIPVLALFGAATVRLLPAVTMVISHVTTLRYYLHAMHPVHRDIMQQRERTDSIAAAQTKDKLPFRQEIRLNNVQYVYPDSTEQALRGVDLTIPKGAVVGFVGASGAGKSTIVDVILGLLEPQEGQILVDGVDTAGQIRKWQNNVGYIPQFIYLSDDTIGNNIAFGIPEKEISKDKVAAAVKAAQLEDLVRQLPDGLDTVIGERGVRLSGGQRQRIGIARALYDNPAVLIMDEATSALDNVTEKHVIKAIEALRGERTIIMIAHRLTTVMNCDHLYLMEQGRIIREGTYRELLRSSSQFREMAMESGTSDVPV